MLPRLRPAGGEALRSVERVGQILSLFGTGRSELGVSEAARALGISKSSAYGLLTSLAKIGLLTRTENARYRLGERILTLAETYRATHRLSPETQALLWEVAARLRCVVSLAVLEGGSVVFVERAAHHPQASVRVPLGVRLPVHASAAGKVLLAFRPERELRTTLPGQGELRPLTENTITTFDQLLRELRRVREAGFAYNLGEAFPYDYCLAVPVWGEGRRVIGAVSISMSRRRFWQHRDAALAAAREVSIKVSGALPGARG